MCLSQVRLQQRVQLVRLPVQRPMRVVHRAYLIDFILPQLEVVRPKESLSPLPTSGSSPAAGPGGLGSRSWA